MQIISSCRTFGEPAIKENNTVVKSKDWYNDGSIQSRVTIGRASISEQAHPSSNTFIGILHLVAKQS